MTKTLEPELNGTDTDRGALDLLLGWFPPVRSFDAYECSIDEMNEAWTEMAGHLAALPEPEFDDILAIARRVEDLAIAGAADIGKRKDKEAEGKRFVVNGARRAVELLAVIVDWRHGTWEAAEIAAGRDPHQVASV